MTTEATPISTAPNIIERVAAFNALMQSAQPGVGFNADRVGFYTGMQLEELAETIRCISGGCVSPLERDGMRIFADRMDLWGKEFKANRHQGAIVRCDREELLDGAIDVLVVTTGSLVYQTPAYNNAVACVLDTNDAKAPNGVVTRDENNKIMKPPGWKPPNLQPFVDMAVD